MTFSLISVAVFLIAALIIIIEVVRALKRGFRKTLITLASLFLALFSSIIIAYFTSDLLAMLGYNLVNRIVDFSRFSEKIPSLKEIVMSYTDAVIAPAVFLITFFVMRGIIAIFMAIVNKSMANKISINKYESEDAPYYRKKPALTNALLGAFCGFMVAVICISPLMGTLKMLTKSFERINENSGTFGIKIKSDVIQNIDNYSNDIVGNVIYYCGGNLVYKSTATSTLNGNHFGFEREVDETFSTMGDIMKVSSTLSNISSASEVEKDKLRNLGSNINKAETLKRVAADVVPQLAENWSKNESYEGVEKPKINRVASTFFNQMLHVCTKSTTETVGEDLSTLLNVYLIAYENGILMSENYKDMLEKSKQTGALELIKKELKKNPRMASISLEIDNMTVSSLATAIQSVNLDNYDVLVGEISGVLNDAMRLDGEERLNYIRRYTKGYIHDYGIDIGDDVVDEVTQRLVDEVMNKSGGEVSIDDIKAFRDNYSVKKNNNTQQNSPTIDQDNFFEGNTDLEEPSYEEDITDDEYYEGETEYPEVEPENPDDDWVVMPSEPEPDQGSEWNDPYYW